MHRFVLASSAIALALAAAPDVLAATDADLAEIRDQIRQLKESYEARIQALEQRLKEAEESAVSQMTVVDVRTEQCWMLIADIANFTPLSQRTPADDLAALVGSWVRVCKEQIEKNGGAINKFLGDGFMAYWRGQEALEKVAGWVDGLTSSLENPA